MCRWWKGGRKEDVGGPLGPWPFQPSGAGAPVIALVPLFSVYSAKSILFWAILQLSKGNLQKASHAYNPALVSMTYDMPSRKVIDLIFPAMI